MNQNKISDLLARFVKINCENNYVFSSRRNTRQTKLFNVKSKIFETEGRANTRIMLLYVNQSMN